jgi:hypothetical protein
MRGAVLLLLCCLLLALLQCTLAVPASTALSKRQLAIPDAAKAVPLLPNGVSVVAPSPVSAFCRGQPQLRASDGTQITTGVGCLIA